MVDIGEKYKSKGNPWQISECSDFSFEKTQIPPFYAASTSSLSTAVSDAETRVESEQKSTLKPNTKGSIAGLRTRFGSTQAAKATRRVDFHWSVREKNDLLWFSDLLNRAAVLTESYLGQKLTLNINAHVTAPSMSISTHVFRYLLDSYRTEDCPVSALTGLRATSHFGRPDYNKVLKAFYEEMREEEWQGKVGVFL